MATVQRLAVISIPSKDRYRVRVPGELASTLGWPKSDGGTDCLGIFRRHGELLCIAQELESNEHIQTLRGIAESVESSQTHTGSIAEVPAAEELVLPFRVIKFRAVWLKSPSTQLELQLSILNTERLGWTSGSQASIFAISWSRYLLLTSEARYSEIHTAHVDVFG